MDHSLCEDLDQEWVELMKEANQIGLSIDEVMEFLLQHK